MRFTAAPHLPGSAHAGLIGIRPEDLHEDQAGPIELRITAVEELGATRLVHGTVEGERLTVTLPPDRPLGETLRLGVTPGATHLFNAESGARIGV